MEIYGGDPKIIASRDEIQRCKHWLIQTKLHLQKAKTEIDFVSVVPGLELPDLISFTRLQFQLPAIESELDRLISACDLASEGYFSTEARLAREISERYVKPVTTIPWVLLMAITPRERYALNPLIPITTALGLNGAISKPSSASVQSVRTAVDLAPAAFSKPPWPFGSALGYQPKDVSSLLGQINTNLALLGVWGVSAGKAKLIQTSSVTPAKNLKSHLAKLKHSYFNPMSSIHIESYQKPNGRDLVVYIPGTQSNALGGKNPLDMKSNLELMTTKGLAASETAVLAALTELKASANDRVLFVGHSQGGLVASNIAVSNNEFEVAGLISVGAPIANQPLTIPTIAIEHTNDLVPALSGSTNPLTESWVTIHADIEAESIMAAHSVSGYLETAAKVDQLANPGVENILSQLKLTADVGQKYVFEIYR